MPGTTRRRQNAGRAGLKRDGQTGQNRKAASTQTQGKQEANRVPGSHNEAEGIEEGQESP